MGKVIELRPRKRQDPEVVRLVRISDEIDAVILKYLRDTDVDPRDIAGLLAHRLGTLMRHIDEKDRLWGVCEKVAKKQAALE